MEAAAAYRKAIELNSAGYGVWGNLGSALSQVPGREAEAKEAYDKAIERAEALRKTQPKDAELLSILGKYYAAVGAKEKSLPLLRQALALTPEDPQVLLRVAMANEILHQRGEALTLIGNALSHGLLAADVDNEASLAGYAAIPIF